MDYTKEQIIEVLDRIEDHKLLNCVYWIVRKLSGK